MLNIQLLTFHQSGVPLLQNCNLQVFAGERVGLVGKNGCGKSTLFRLIRGAVKPDAGDVNLQTGKTIAFVEQEIISSDQTVLDFVLDGDIELRQLEHILGQEAHDAAWFEAQQRYETIDGYGAQARAAHDPLRRRDSRSRGPRGPAPGSRGPARARFCVMRSRS